MDKALTREQLEAHRSAGASGRPGPRANAQLRLHVLASGSKGNCSVIENLQSGALLAVDCGISKSAFMERCAACSLDPTRIEGILVTHEHTDHTKGLGVVTRGLAKKGAHPTLFASNAVRQASRDIRALEGAMHMEGFARGDDFVVAGVAVHAFATSHDAAESFGFRFDLSGDSVGFMTDTGIVTGEAHEALRGCHVLAIEANHDPVMLKYGPYPRYLKERIASERGHLSNVQSAELLEQLLCNELERVVGMHVSETNNDYMLPAEALQEVLRHECHPAFARAGYQNTPISV